MNLYLATALLMLSCIALAPPANSAHWSYSDPNSWPKEHKSCMGREQSPININSQSAKRMNIPPLQFHKYESFLPMEITNNGHSVALKPAKINNPQRDMPFISGGNLPGKFILHELHLHWGSKSWWGSEHTINNKTYPAELHMVHYNQKYGSLENAVKHPDGVAVLSVLFSVQMGDNPNFHHFFRKLPEIRTVGQKTINNNPITLKKILPSNTKDFYRYHGSLTTPECQESVFWTVFATPILVSERQLGLLRSNIRDSSGHVLKDNHRPLQKVNGRTIYLSRG